MHFLLQHRSILIILQMLAHNEHVWSHIYIYFRFLVYVYISNKGISDPVLFLFIKSSWTFYTIYLLGELPFMHNVYTWDKPSDSTIKPDREIMFDYCYEQAKTHNRNLLTHFSWNIRPITDNRFYVNTLFIT